MLAAPERPPRGGTGAGFRAAALQLLLRHFKGSDRAPESSQTARLAHKKQNLLLPNHMEAEKERERGQRVWEHSHRSLASRP